MTSVIKYLSATLPSQRLLLSVPSSALDRANINAQYFFDDKDALQRSAIEKALHNAYAEAQSIAKTVKRPMGQVYPVIGSLNVAYTI